MYVQSKMTHVKVWTILMMCGSTWFTITEQVAHIAGQNASTQPVRIPPESSIRLSTLRLPFSSRISEASRHDQTV